MSMNKLIVNPKVILLRFLQQPYHPEDIYENNNHAILKSQWTDRMMEV